jgi:hypothetical protein
MEVLVRLVEVKSFGVWQAWRSTCAMRAVARPWRRWAGWVTRSSMRTWPKKRWWKVAKAMGRSVASVATKQVEVVTASVMCWVRAGSVEAQGAKARRVGRSERVAVRMG